MLTAKALERAIAAHEGGQEATIAVGGCPGLKLRITRAGVASWTLRYRVPEGQRRVTLGRYPVMSMSEARKAGHRLLGGIASGDDPSAQRRERFADRKSLTFGELADKWVSGELHRTYPDHVPALRRMRDNETRLDLHIKPRVGKVPLALFTLDHAERVMARLPEKLAPKTRRHVAQLMNRVLNLAVYPVRAIEHNPIPRGWLPRGGSKKAKAWLRPAEEAKLAACRAVPLELRMVWAFLAREGMRAAEALDLTWHDLDLKAGVVTLDENKTDDPRAWALGADVTAALKRWRTMRRSPRGDEVVFPLPGSELRSDQLREALMLAGVKRPQLFESTDARMPMRVHDLRGTFTTLALATGRSEAWVTDRTGHKSSQMVALYKRAARTAGELRLGWLKPMNKAIPELQPRARKARGADVIDLAARRRATTR